MASSCPRCAPPTSRVTVRRGLALRAGVGALALTASIGALVPKCPLCLVAYASVLGLGGVSAGTMGLLGAVALVLGLVLVGRRLRRTLRQSACTVQL